MTWLKSHAAQRPDSPEMQQVLARWLRTMGDAAGARQAWERAKALAPDLKSADFELARLDFEGGQIDAARERLNRVLKQDQRDVTARLLLATLEEKAGYMDKARELYQLILVGDPTNLMALNNLASILSEYGNDPAAALPYAEKVYQLASDSAAVNDTLGWAYYQNARASRAIFYLESAVKLQPTALRKTHLALAYFEDGRSQLAKNTIDDALKMQPDLPQAIMAKAKITGRRN